MARPRLNILLTDVSSPSKIQRASVDASVNLYEVGTTTPVTVYDSASGGSTVSSFVSNSLGLVEGSAAQDLYLDQARDIRVTSDAGHDFVFPAITGSDLGGRELGRATKADANATATTTYSTYTDITGLSITVDVASGQSIVVRLYVGGVFNPGGTTVGNVLAIRESSTVLTEAVDLGRTVADGPPMSIEVALAPSAGSHTYKASLTRLTATGTATAVFNSLRPGSLIARSA